MAVLTTSNVRGNGRVGEVVVWIQSSNRKNGFQLCDRDWLRILLTAHPRPPLHEKMPFRMLETLLWKKNTSLEMIHNFAGCQFGRLDLPDILTMVKWTTYTS